MKLHDFHNRFFAAQPFRNCIERCTAGEHFSVSGLSGSAVSILTSGLAEQHDGQFIVVAPDFQAAEIIQYDLEAIGDKQVNYFPAYRGIHLEEKQINTDVRLARIQCLQSLLSGKKGVYVLECRTLLQEVVPPQQLTNRILTVKKGEETDFDFFAEYLVEEGFKREIMVEDFGDISIRGGIIDIFSLSGLEPVRIEFDGNTIESIRVFDINTQRSLKETEHVSIVPPVPDTSGIFIPDLSGGTASVLDYFPDDAPLFFHQPIFAKKTIHEFIERLNKARYEESDRRKIDSSEIFQHIEERLSARSSAYIRNTLHSTHRDSTIHFQMKTLPKFRRNLNFFSQFFAELQDEYPEITLTILCDGDSQADRLRNLILDEDLLAIPYFIRSGILTEGFLSPQGQIAILNDHEIFDRKHFRKPKRIYKARKVLMDDLSLQIGDFVVHEDYGIGQYLGLDKISIGKSEQEALKIAYREGDSLYLNIEKLPNLEKYTGQEGYKPELSKLGGADWDRVKKKTKKSVENIAKELVGLYAKRSSKQGITFSADTQWQQELEASFEYEETPDQLKACWEIKKDMESSNSMDRLVCGDVGFGKTEVALRASFKAVNDSKQVAVLVPTTILAQQHYDTFRKRMKQYPVTIEMLSRFRTPKQQKAILAGLLDGSVDIVIGTHRLLSKDIAFSNLGLTIIDEEQRFGVKHKEKLKHLRSEVDVLTLTATPIPRTMHMSLLGVRDLSVINTPPKNRMSIITEIAEFDDDLVRAAIIKELDRGGQIYFVHNKVRTIYKLHDTLQKLVPEASFGVAHGQMKERDLEEVMHAFLREEFSCLISTMIIESGLDIPSVNTIIVNQAENFGLAQLYQLRGRVGRSDIQAFAYLLIPRFEKMSEDSLKRLQTLTEHTELGSGLNIALNDLEIRGAGNLLGSEQSGQINAVGYNMFTRLVKESVSEHMNEMLPEDEAQKTGVQEAYAVKIDTDISAYFPDSYIPDPFQRVSLYRKISFIDSVTDLNEIKEDLSDRFGTPPDQAENLLHLIKLKLQASQLSMKRISIMRHKFTGTFAVDAGASAVEKEQLAQLVSSFVENATYPFQLKQESNLKLELPVPSNSDRESLSYIGNFLKYLKSA